MTAITSIIAKIVILVDAFLESFVTVSVAASAGNCGINQISGGLTPCGQEVLQNWLQGFVFEYTQMTMWFFWLGRAQLQ